MERNLTKIENPDFALIKAGLNSGVKLQFQVVSGSMEPLIKIGDQIKIKKIKNRELKKFDIIVFHQTDKLICHYVRHINRTNFGGDALIITQGLNSRGEDFPVAASQILGVVTSHKISHYSKFKFYFKELLRKLFKRN